ncbi:putative toxin-antitoxin system, antitoxin component [Trichinella spiralis]|uniref:putative toxin-antitoxin system, antitoxin component n=1 Tax=Trichinella spiralis TaxID=6334 RepID=UPI0001EFBE68|nr:putative toxin-antitoxin system, antitoxin component [Trichinella spiralis]
MSFIYVVVVVVAAAACGSGNDDDAAFFASSLCFRDVSRRRVVATKAIGRVSRKVAKFNVQTANTGRFFFLDISLPRLLVVDNWLLGHLEKRFDRALYFD